VLSKIKNNLIDQAVSKLKAFGFIHVSADNIMKDEVYKYFFEKILKEKTQKNVAYLIVIDELLNEIKAANDHEDHKYSNKRLFKLNKTPQE
jgi:hypothetical protein